MLVLPSRPDGDQTGVAYPEFREWEEEARSFEAMSLVWPQSVGVTGGGKEPKRIRGMLVTAGFFGAPRSGAAGGGWCAAPDREPPAPARWRRPRVAVAVGGIGLLLAYGPSWIRDPTGSRSTSACSRSSPR